jgi:hypothetical protein
MNDPEKLPQDMLFLRWGALHLGAVGRPALMLVALIVVALFGARVLGLI